MAPLPPDPLHVLDLDATKVHTPDSNNPDRVKLENLQELLLSMKTHGQLLPGIVAKHPTIEGEWIVLDGNKRAAVSRFMGITFKAIEHQGPVTESALAETRIAANHVREKMDDDSLAKDFELLMREKDLDQAELAKRYGISPGEVSRCLGFSKKASAKVLEAARSGLICRTSCRLIANASDDHQQQDQVLAMVLKDPSNPMKRDAIDALVKRLRGKKPAPRKKVTASMASGFSFALPSMSDLQAVMKDVSRLLEAVKKIIQTGGGPDALPAFIK